MVPTICRCRGDASRSATEISMFLKNCWYMGGWDHELIDGKLLRARILTSPCCSIGARAARSSLWTIAAATAARSCRRAGIEGDCVRCMYHGLKFDPTGKCVQIPGQDRIPPKLGVQELSRSSRSSTCIWIWMGDPAQGRPLAHPRLPLPAQTRLEGHSGLPALRRQLSADRRQPERLRPPRLRAHEDAGRLGGVCLRDQAGRRSSAWSDGFRVERWHMNSDAAAVPPQGHHEQERQASIAATSRRMHDPGHLLHGHAVRAGGQGAEAGQPEGTLEYRNCQFMTPETRAHDPLLLELPERLRRRRSHDLDVAPRQPDRGLHGGQGDHRSASRRCSTPTRASNSSRSRPTLRCRTSGTSWTR